MKTATISRARMRIVLAKLEAQVRLKIAEGSLPFLCIALKRVGEPEERAAVLAELRKTAIAISGPQAVQGYAWWEEMNGGGGQAIRLRCVRLTRRRFAVRRKAARRKA